MKNILVSACLLGEPCRYDGKSKPCERVIALKNTYNLIPICPEVMGGLPTPRTPSEICGERVLMKDGRDVTENYNRGAQKALEIARENACTVAILKEKSPSCGSGLIHNGSFDGGLVKGDGITTQLLKQNGIRVLGESEITENFAL
ncbi:MAG: DUF523 domain-containing protein [Ruminococcaceae bacterium]|nr:DUF523 domain-containing protein [Oscillospiraceae bacterium]